MKAWLLAVVSSEGQRENLADYLALAKADADQQGWVLERTGDFTDVASGKRGVRSPVLALTAAIAALPPASRPAWVWMRRVDRVGRGKATESTIALQTIHGLGVRIWDHDVGEVNPGTIDGEMTTFMRALLARIDNEAKSGKLKVNYKQKRASGLAMGNKRPYGLVLGPDKRDVAVPDQAEAVRLAFEMRANGGTFYGIARRLLEIAPPVRYKCSGERGVRWSAQRVKRMLANRVYIGPVVDELTFARAQRRVLERPPRKYVWELSGGSLRCYCGWAMSGNFVAGRSGTGQRYYKCYAGWNHENGWGRSVRAEKLESQCVEAIASFATDLESLKRYRQPVRAAALSQRALETTERRGADVDRQWAKIWELHLAGKLRDDDLASRLDELRAERTTLAERTAALRTQLLLAENADQLEQDAQAIVSEAARWYAEAKPERRAELLRAIVPHIGSGLCAEQDGTLTFRVPDQQRQARQTKRLV